MEDYDKAVALWPNLAEAYYFRAILHGQLKEHQQAIRDYTKAIDLKPALIEAYYFRALNQGAAGKYEEALRDMKTAAELGYEPAKRFLESHIARPERN
jgi:tetratricopeptide (TPR) repeat protein